MDKKIIVLIPVVAFLVLLFFWLRFISKREQYDWMENLLGNATFALSEFAIFTSYLAVSSFYK